MAISRNWRVLSLLFFFCFLCAQNVSAQKQGNPVARDFTGSDRGGNSYRVVETPDGFQIVQRLTWIRDENDFRYEVIIEKQNEKGVYGQILRQSRTENFIETNLTVGRYRYRILVYNLLDRLEYSTNWSVFSIDQARPPVLRRISPDHIVLTGEAADWVIEIEGVNLLPDSEVSLRPRRGGDPILPAEYAARADRSGGRVVFRAAGLAAGAYELCVKNSGGFEARRRCSVRNPFSIDWSVTAAYEPPLPLHGYLSELFDGGIYPLGFSLRADYLPLAGPWGSVGAEAFASWNYFSAEKTELSATAHFLDFRLGLIYQYNLSPRMILGLRLGGGATLSPGLSYTIKGFDQSPISTWIPSAGGGLSLKWRFHPRFFAALGLEYRYLFSVDGPTGFLSPFIGVGWKY
jgi:hypothetical protein